MEQNSATQIETQQRNSELNQDAHTTTPVITEAEFKKSGAWGLYTCVDVFGCSVEKLSEEEHIRNYTIELCDKLGVNRYGDPQMVLFGHEPAIFGWSMSQMIETSLVAGHFIQQPKSAYIDIFSCKFYDAQKIIDFTVEFFEGDTFTYHSILRENHGKLNARDYFNRISGEKAKEISKQ